MQTLIFVFNNTEIVNNHWKRGIQDLPPYQVIMSKDRVIIRILYDALIINCGETNS